MDLRPFNPSRAQLDRARDLVIQGLITYQPWIFADDLETGVGLEFELDEYVGLVYDSKLDPVLLERPELRRIIVRPSRLAEFRSANQRLRQLYDGLADRLSAAIGGVSGSTMLDVGCNTGYFPIAFSRRGATCAVGCDRQDFSASISLLNEILGANATFVAARYDPHRRTVDGVEGSDLVTSLAVLCHVSDPLQHLACLGGLARKALFVWTIVNRDSGMTLHYGEPRGDYPEDRFPFCFDNRVCPSIDLLKRSFELLGFREVIDLPGLDDNLPRYSVRGYSFHGLLGLR